MKERCALDVACFAQLGVAATPSATTGAWMDARHGVPLETPLRV